MAVIGKGRTASNAEQRDFERDVRQAAGATGVQVLSVTFSDHRLGNGLMTADILVRCDDAVRVERAMHAMGRALTRIRGEETQLGYYDAGTGHDVPSGQALIQADPLFLDNTPDPDPSADLPRFGR